MWKKIIKFIFSPKCKKCKKGKFDAIKYDKFLKETLFKCDNCGYELWQ